MLLPYRITGYFAGTNFRELIKSCLKFLNVAVTHVTCQRSSREAKRANNLLSRGYHTYSAVCVAKVGEAQSSLCLQPAWQLFVL